MAAALAMVAALVPLAARGGERPAVAIVKGKDVGKMMAEAMELLGGTGQFVRDGQKVVIKPNLVYQPSLKKTREGRRGGPICQEHTADVRIVEALARQMRQAARCSITIAEGTPNNLAELYELLGYTRLAREMDLELVDVDAAPRTTVVLGGPPPKTYSLPAVTQTSDVLVDVAVMKTHYMAGVTLGMKNLFGLLPIPKHRFHAQLDEVLCDLVTARKPDLVVIDGLVAMEGQGPLWGSPVAMDLIIAGRSVVAVDAVCAAVMGLDPTRIPHLALAHERGLGEVDPKKIDVRGLAIAAVRRPFAPAMWDAEVRMARTDALVGRLVAMADKVSKPWGRGSLELSFRARLQADRRKYPGRRPQSLVIRVPHGGDQILFHVPYRTAYPECAEAACDEAIAWIREHLGPDIPAVRAPTKPR